MTREKAIEAASKAAAAAFKTFDGPKQFTWLDCLNDNERIGARSLAQFVSANPDAPAESLYLFAMAGEPNVKPWGEIAPAVRVACEVFRASYKAVMVLVAAAEAAQPKPQARGPTWMRESAFEERSAGYGDVVDFRERR